MINSKLTGHESRAANTVTQAKKLGRRDQAGLSIGALRTFVTVAEIGSFSAAANALGVSQPNVSNQINALEQACGGLLIYRRTQTLSLTELGREIYIRARLVVSRMGELEESAKLFTKLRTGRLTIGFSTPRTAFRYISKFVKKWPNINIQTRCANTTVLMREILDCKLDAAIFSLLQPEPNLSCQLIENRRLKLLVPQTHPCVEDNIVRSEDLIKMNFVLREEGSVTRALTEKLFASLGQVCMPSLTVETCDAVREAVANDMGVSTVFEGEVENDSRVTALDIDGFNKTAGVYLVSLIESLEIPALREFTDSVLELHKNNIKI